MGTSMQYPDFYFYLYEFPLKNLHRVEIIPIIVLINPIGNKILNH